ncbi:DUF2332 domain-containing protein [Halovenus rubra]|uniref:DUF2332 domain-containing protein n=2 Tax=Halovenus rubra TaxID=869890 RepID=A0ACC7DYD6_9EURY|nr:DUF2332 domain-containing protein [Halovenus rubra]
MESVREEFRWFADWAAGTAPLYEVLASRTATDTQLLRIADESPDSQPAPNLLFAAAHYLLLDDSSHRLAEFYPTCVTDPRSPDREETFEAFRDFIMENESTVRTLIQSRRVQTNAVGRSALLFPAFKQLVENHAEQPVALVEIGSSAGLNLYWDKYQYQYNGYGTYGASHSPVQIESDVRGNTVPPFWRSEPEIAQRVGIDSNPLDVTDSTDAEWLRALVMPDQQWRVDRLDDAISLVRNEQPTIVEGNALDVLPEILADIPKEYDICVFSTLVLYQFETEQIASLRRLLNRASQERTVHWLSDVPTGEQTPPTYRSVSFDDEITTREIAEYKAHGEWIRWRD